MKSRETKKDIITVVVPCYNVEAYIERCLDSLLTQTYKDIKVLLIDDNSTDKTKKIIMRYVKKYPKIFTAICNEKCHGTAGYSRNIGIKKSKSKFIAFLDPDDWLPENYYEQLYVSLSSGDYDLSICDIILRYDDSGRDVRFSAHSDYDMENFISTGLAAASPNKLFKREIFDGITYPEDIMNEDIPVILPILAKFKTVYNKNTYYNYYQRAGSKQNEKVTPRRFDVFEAIGLTRERIKGHVSKNVWDSIVYYQIIEILIGVVPKISGFRNRKEFIKRFYKETVKYEIEIKGNGYLSKIIEGDKQKYIEHLVNAFLDRRFSKAAFITGVKRAVRTIRSNKFVSIGLFAISHPLQFFKKAKNKLHKRSVIKPNISMHDVVLVAESQNQLQTEKRLSVIIPNYNYEKFFLERIYSILNQTEKIGEVIVLDDVSSDGSIKLIEKVIKKIETKVDIRLIANSENQGTFRQWERGFNEAKYDYVWIAEADDYSDSRFLENVMAPMVENEDVVLGYSDTAFIDEKGFIIKETIKPEIDFMRTRHWKKSFVNNGREEGSYMAVNCTIANVSSVVFRKIRKNDYKKMFTESRDFKQVGDWMFYFNYLLLGDIAYTDKPLNYYRNHGTNVSSVMRQRTHFEEMQKVHQKFMKKLHLDEKTINRIHEYESMVKKAWGIK